MKFQATTIGLVAIAILLGGVVYFTESRNSSDPTAEEGAGGKIFSFEESQIQAFTVETPDQTISFEKDDAGQWQMQEPEQGTASDAAVAYLLNLLTTGESDRTLTTTVSNTAEFGLDEPSATIDVELDNQETHQLILGTANFDGSAIYAQADPESNSESTSEQPAETEAEEAEIEEAEITVLQVSPDLQNAVNRPLEDWRSQTNPEATGEPDADSPELSEPEVSEPEQPE